MDATYVTDYFVRINYVTLTKIMDDAALSRAILDWLEAEWQLRRGFGPVAHLVAEVQRGVPLRTAWLVLQAEADGSCNPPETVHN